MSVECWGKRGGGILYDCWDGMGDRVKDNASKIKDGGMKFPSG